VDGGCARAIRSVNVDHCQIGFDFYYDGARGSLVAGGPNFSRNNGKVFVFNFGIWPQKKQLYLDVPRAPLPGTTAQRVLHQCGSSDVLETGVRPALLCPGELVETGA
jgi:hypothetical protein